MLATVCALCWPAWPAVAATGEIGLGAFALRDEARSARDRSESDQLKPSPAERNGNTLDVRLQVKGADSSDGVDEAKARVRGLVLEVMAVGQLEAMGALPLMASAFPLAAPVRTSRSTRAPMLMRRAKGEAGAVTGPSPSSMTLSSRPAEPVPALEMLSRLEAAEPKGDVWVGDVPDRPRVEMDMRRRVWALAAALAIGPG